MSELIQIKNLADYGILAVIALMGFQYFVKPISSAIATKITSKNGDGKNDGSKAKISRAEDDIQRLYDGKVGVSQCDLKHKADGERFDRFETSVNSQFDTLTTSVNSMGGDINLIKNKIIGGSQNEH